MKFVRMTADWPMADRFKAPGGQRTKIELITLGCHTFRDISGPILPPAMVPFT
jgi:hypothetical protein